MLLRRNKRKFGPVQVPDATPGALAQSVEDAAGRLADRVNHAQLDVRRSRLKPKWIEGLGRRRLNGDAMLKAQLAKTSRELAHESSDLSQAVNSLNAVIRTNRRAAARGRTRLIGGLAIGAALMYHLDSEHGPERRAATARRVRSIAGAN